TLFDKAESASNILNWLDTVVYPNKEDRPDYICIDKACLVLRHLALQPEYWNEWSQTTRFIVDTYHYINHKADDLLCRTYCNPTLESGDLVGERIDDDGTIHKVREFNTEASEQLNAWMTGFDSILKRMVAKNFRWFLHSMLFYHVKHVLEKKNINTSNKEVQVFRSWDNEDDEDEVVSSTYEDDAEEVDAEVEEVEEESSGSSESVEENEEVEEDEEEEMMVEEDDEEEDEYSD
ncbi:hypothetical protein BDN70DRAFT_901817, partial [Pholiota conissans]